MYQIQISKRRQKFVSYFEFVDPETARFWFNALRLDHGARKRLVKA